MYVLVSSCLYLLSLLAFFILFIILSTLFANDLQVADKGRKKKSYYCLTYILLAAVMNDLYLADSGR